MTESTQPEVTSPAHTIESVVFDETYIDHPFIPSRDPKDVKAFFADFAKAQAGYQPVLREREVTIKPRGEAPAYKFKYAELANVIEAPKSLSGNGITVTQPVHQALDGKLWLYTIVAHASGAGQVTRIRLEGAPDMKIFGGEITYIRRYTYGPAIGVASEDDADDNGSGGGDPRGPRGSYDDEQHPPTQRTTTTKPTPQRKPPAEPAAGKDAAAAAKPTTGALKNLTGKIEALALPPEDLAGMLAGLEVSEDPNAWSLADWTKVKAEVDARMKR